MRCRHQAVIVGDAHRDADRGGEQDADDGRHTAQGPIDDMQQIQHTDHIGPRRDLADGGVGLAGADAHAVYHQLHAPHPHHQHDLPLRDGEIHLQRQKQHPPSGQLAVGVPLAVDLHRVGPLLDDVGGAPHFNVVGTHK